MKKAGSILIVDGNLFARKMFYKFRNLSSTISLNDLGIVSSNLAKALSPKVSPKKKKIRKEIVNRDNGEVIKVEKNSRIDGRLSKIIEDKETKSSKVKVSTGVAYGMTKSLLSIFKTYDIRYIIFGYDPIRKEGNIDRTKEFRSNLDKEYKANRESQYVDEFVIQLFLAQCILRLLGIEQVWTPTFEADDILHFYAKKVFKKDNCLILTSDHDLFPLLDKRNSILKVGSKKPLFTLKDFNKKFGITPREYKDSMSLSGCSGDNVKGVKGISVDTAIDLMKTFGSLKNLLKNFGKSPNIDTRVKNILAKEKENRFKTVLLTRKIVKLYGMNETFQNSLIVKRHNGSDNYKNLLFVLKALKFKSLLGEEERAIYKKIIKNQRRQKLWVGKGQK